MILIKEDHETEMMEIYNGDKCIFCGNTWDFQVSGHSIKELLKDCGVKDVKVEKYNYED